MNYYKQVAEMLGVELEEEFKLKADCMEKPWNNLYRISENGFEYKSIHENWENDDHYALSEILSGKKEIVKIPWKPKRNERYWRYQPNISEATWSIWCDDVVDLYRWKCGNCFRTEEEARTKGKEIMKQIQKEYEEA